MIDDVIEVWFLVCKLRTSHGIHSMTSSVVSISQGVFVVQISTSYHVKNLIYYARILYTPCTHTILKKEVYAGRVNNVLLNDSPPVLTFVA